MSFLAEVALAVVETFGWGFINSIHKLWSVRIGIFFTVLVKILQW